MPNRPAKICSHCKARHNERGAYCAEHKSMGGSKFSGKREQDHHSFYHTPLWRSTRRIFLAQFPLCVHCRANGITTPGTVVDHIVPIRLGGHMTDPNNLQTLCASCHNSKTAKGL